MRFTKTLAFLFVFVATTATQAYAITPREIIDGTVLLPRTLGFGFNLNDTYRIGDEWGKKPVTEADLQSDANFRRMALATAKVRTGGTGFYLGEFNGKMIFATNHHVCEAAYQCKGRGTVTFPLLDVTADVVEFYGSWPEIDLSLMAIAVPSDAKAAAKLNAVGAPFAFSTPVHHGEPLVTIGFGVADNPMRQLVANRDADCMVFSGDGEYRLMADPDDLNPAPYRAWSFANGCDVSHGDSGSAMMDRETGKIVGIIWTGRIPKSEKVQSSAYLDQLMQTPNDDVWKELSYAVPAVKMKEYLSEQLNKGAIDPEYQQTLRQLLQAE